MAHIFQVPMSLEFRSVSVEWERAIAHIKRWAKADDGSVDTMHLIAQTPRLGSIKLPISQLPEFEKRLLGTRKGSYKSNAGKQCSPECDVELFVHKESQPMGKRKGTASSVSDAWQMRDDFLGIKSNDVDSVGKFLNKWGSWRQFRRYVSPREVTGLQQAVRGALISSPARWFGSGLASLPIAQTVNKKLPHFVVFTSDCETAIRVATTLDLLRKLEFRTCARADCGKLFQVTSKHSRAYCTQYCGHLEAVRRNRKPQAARQRKGA